MKKTSKNYNNALYIYDNSLILKDNNKYYETKFKRSILNKGIIKKREDFINNYLAFLKQNHLSRFLWAKKILIIHSEDYSVNDKSILKNVFLELGYKKVEIINEISALNLNKTDCYLIGSKNPRLYYLNEYNEKLSLTLDNTFSEKEKATLIKNRCQNKNLFIIKENPYLLNFIDNLKINYYYFASPEPFLLKNL